MAFQFPVKALYDAVVAELDAHGVGDSDGIKSFFGEKHITGNHAPPRYVWVPVGAKPDELLPTRETSDDPEEDPEYRAIGCDEIVFEVGIWGRSHDEVWALRQNLLKAINDQAAIDAGPDGDTWAKGQAWNQAGELDVIRLSLKAAVEDCYISIPPLERPDPSTVTVEAVEGAILAVDPIDEDPAPDPVLETTTDDPAEEPPPEEP